ncbi:hypothetical protein [Xenorhabdus doucetiae]|uniref:Uncharacterized protein n=1 Tax=Xenorhabdus doucetiae TaxID=351671 RepID=A0A068QNB5_9GAMM|nr:hypothetical protein [Xenorhabdus doucetiae]TYP03188.1 hypothetical protein LY16_02392 [Xenorhabdus doucetiae]CDG16393.1 conserved protein of unknown function [Xenorhabdus doucetiae]
MYKQKKKRDSRVISLRDSIRNKKIEIILHQEIDFTDCYRNNKFILFDSYICGINLKFFGKNEEHSDQIRMKFLPPICYAINKVYAKVNNLSKIMRNINIYIGEEEGKTEVRWPAREDKIADNTSITKTVGIGIPHLHINAKKVKEIKSPQYSFWGRNKNITARIGWGVPDQLYHEAISGSRKSLELNSENSTKVIAAIVHEIGHIIHAQRTESKEKFWLAKRIDQHNIHNIPAKIVEQVSGYAIEKQNSNEFVAEVFTGLVYGKKYSQEVLEYYQYYSGPELTGIKLPELPPNWSP